MRKGQSVPSEVLPEVICKISCFVCFARKQQIIVIAWRVQTILSLLYHQAKSWPSILGMTSADLCFGCSACYCVPSRRGTASKDSTRKRLPGVLEHRLSPGAFDGQSLGDDVPSTKMALFHVLRRSQTKSCWNSRVGLCSVETLMHSSLLVHQSLAPELRSL